MKSDSIMPSRKNLALLGPKEWLSLMQDLGEPAYRAEQIRKWIWQRKVFDFEKMSDLSKALRERLSTECRVDFPLQVASENSTDGTKKMLFRLEDGKSVETVWIPREDQDRVTVCISTQVGCRMGCTFCLTAQQKVERNLSSGEIAAQLLLMPEREKITNVVVMGMGEPFDNYDELMQALELISDPKSGMGIGPRKVTVSTSGLVPKIHRFVRETKSRLAVSLNAPNDEIREQIMPINKAYNMDKLLSALREISGPEYPKTTKASRFYVTFEYILIAGLNDQPEHAKELVQRLKGLPCKVNLLLYNENPNVPFKRPDAEAVSTFQGILSRAGMLNFVRRSRGRDISAACGQLASLDKRRGMDNPGGDRLAI